MDNENNSLDANIVRSQEVSLDAQPAVVGGSSSGSGFGHKHITPFGFDRLAFAITAVAVLVVLSISAVTYFLINSSKSKNDPNAPKADKYSVSSVETDKVKQGVQLQVGNVDHLAVNGQLQVSKGLVISPTDTPVTPTLGQFYFSKSTKTPYYFDGTQFVSIKSEQTSIQGITGSVNVGGGISLVNSTLVNSGVISIQGQTGAVNFASGSGIAINGSTITNTGVLGIGGNPNQLAITSTGDGNVQVQIVGIQDGGVLVGTTGNGINSVLPTSGGQCLISDPSTQKPVFGSCSGAPAVTGITVGSTTLTNTVMLQGANGIAVTQSGQTVTIDGSGIAPGGDVSFGATHTAGHITMLDSNGDLVNSDLSQVTGGLQVQNSNYFVDLANSGTSTLTIKNSTGSNVANLTVTGVVQANGGIKDSNGNLYSFATTPTGTSRTICYVDNTAASNCPSGGNVSRGGTATNNKLTKFDSSGNIIDSSILDQTTGLQVAGSAYYLDLANATTSTLTVKNSTSGQVANLSVTGKISTAQGFLNGADTFTLPSNSGNGGVLCYVYNSTTTNCPSGGNVSFGTTHNNGYITSLDSSGNLVSSPLKDEINGLQVAGSAYYLDLANATASTFTIKNSTSGQVANLKVTGTVEADGGILNSNGNLFALDATPLGTTRTLCYITNLTTTNCPSGGNVSRGGTSTDNKITKFDSSGNIINSSILDQTSGLQLGAVSNAYYLDVFSANDSTLTVKNSSAGKVANLSVTGTVTAAGVSTSQITSTGSNITFTNGSDSFIFPTGGGANKVICVSGGVCATGNGQAVILDPSGGMQATTGTGNAIAVNKQVSTGNILQLQANGTDVFVLTGTGDASFRNAVTLGTSNSTEGALKFANSSNSNLITLQAASGSSAYTVKLPTAIGTSGQCLSLDGSLNFQFSNCVSSIGGGGGITGSGTIGKIAKFTGTGAIGDSILTESGSNLSVAGTLTVTGASSLTLGTSGSGGNVGSIILRNATNSNLVTLQSGTTSNSGGNLTLTLPTADGSNGQCLTTNGSGVLSFAACLSGGGSGGGVTQFNSRSGAITLNGTSNQIAVTESPTGTFTLSTPQDIHSGATPTFNGIVLQGTPTASATSSLIQIGSTIVGGNNSANGGTYIGLNAPNTGAGSAADFLNFQKNGLSKLRVTNAGDLTAAGTITFSGLSSGLVTSSSGALSGGTVDRDSGTYFTGTLSVGNGGTGATTFASNGVLYGNGTSALGVTGAGTSGQLLVANASGVPTFVSLGGDGSLNASGSLAVNKLQGTTISFNSLASGDVLQYNGTNIVNGKIANGNLSAGTFTNITGTGPLVAGSIASGFGTIATGNDITSTTKVQGATLNGTSVIQLNGADINTSGTLTNVAYLGATNTFTAGNTFSSSLSVTGASGLILGSSSTASKLTLYGGGSSTNAIVIQGDAPSGSGNASVSLTGLAAGNSYELCYKNTAGTSGNCTGVGGTVTASGGANNYVARFTGASTLGKGILLDNGSSAYVGNTGATGGGLFNVGTANEFQVSGAGAVKAVGVDSGGGQIQGTGGLSVTGTAISLNTSGNGTTSIGSASAGAIGITSAAAINITGGAASTFTSGSGAFTLQGGNGSGSNVAGSNLVLNGGQGTGTGNGGNISFNIAKPSGSSGSSTNSLSTVVTISGTDGSATFKNATNSATAFQVQNAAGTKLLVTDTSGMKVDLYSGLVLNGIGKPSPTLSGSSSGGTLTAGTYYYRVAAYNANSISGAVNTSPSSRTTTGSTSQNTVSWSAVADATGYYVYRATSAGGPYYRVDVGAATSAVDNGSNFTWSGTDYSGDAGYNGTASITLAQGGGLYLDPSGNGSIFENSSANMLTVGAYGASQGVAIQADNFALQTTAGGSYANTLTIDNTGVTTFQNTANSTGAVAILNTNSKSVAKFDTTNGRLVLGDQSVTNGVTGTITFNTANNNQSVLLKAGATSTGYTLTLPTAAAGVDGQCLTSTTAGQLSFATCTGNAFIQNGNSFNANAVLGTNDNFSLSFKTNGGSRLSLDTSGNLQLQQASTFNVVSNAANAAGFNMTIQGGAATQGTNVGGNLVLQGGAGASTGASGSVIVKSNTNNSATALQVQNAAGTALLNADTTNMRISVGTKGTATSQLYVAGNTPSAHVGQANGAAASYGLAVQGRYAYTSPTGATNGFQVYDISNPASPSLISSLANTIATGNKRVKVQGKYAYVSGWVSSTTGTLQIIDISNPKSPTSVGSVSYTAGNNTPALYVQGRYAYVGDSGTQTLSAIDISNPANPVIAGTVTVASTSNGPADMYVQGRYAYIVSGGSARFQIIDISNPAAMSLVNSGTQFSSSNIAQVPMSVAVQGRYAYVGTTTGGSTYVIDVSDPSIPTPASAIVTSVSQSGVASSLVTQGRYLYESDSSNGLIRTFDISVPASMTLISGTTTAVSPLALVADGRYVYAANNNATGTLQVFDFGGAYTQQLEAGGIETDALNVRGNSSFASDVNIQGGTTIGGSLQVAGNSSFSGQVAINTLTGVGSGGALGSWTSTNTINTAAQFICSFQANGYIFGFENASSAYQYAKLNSDGTTGTWTRVASGARPDARGSYACAYYNGYIYEIGGNNSGDLTTVYRARVYTDGTLGSWVQMTSVNTARSGGAAAVLNGYIYYTGGFVASGSTYSAVVESAKINSDASLGTWTAQTSMTASKSAHSLIAVNGYLYAMGGTTTAGAYANTVYSAQPSSTGSITSWTTQTSLATAVVNPGAVTQNGYIYVVAGQTGTFTATNTYQMAQVGSGGTLGTWTTGSTSLSTNGRYKPAATAYNGYIYIAGGYDPSGFTAVNDVSSSSTQRVKVVASLDLVGGYSGNGSDESVAGGNLTAANVNVLGALQVQGPTNLLQDVSIGKSLTVGSSLSVRPQTDSTAVFQVQNAAGNSLLNVDSSTATVSVGNAGIASTIQIGNTTGAVTQTINIGTNATASSQTNVTIGSTIGLSPTLIQAGTSGTTIKGANSTTAFQIQNSSSQNLLTVDTSNSIVTIGSATNGATAPWTTQATNNLPQARDSQGITTYNGYIYVVGGDKNSTIASTVMYAKANADGSVGAWSCQGQNSNSSLGTYCGMAPVNANTLPTSVSDMSLVAYGGYLYTFGGYDGTNYINKTYVAKINADGSTGAWVDKTSSYSIPLLGGSTGLSDMGTTVYNGWVYLVGGHPSSGSGTSDVYYAKLGANGTMGSWQTSSGWIGGGGQNRRDMGAVVVNGYLYALGGDNGATNPNIYYGKINADGTLSGTSSTAANSLNIGQAGGSVYTANGYLYIVGYYNSGLGGGRIVQYSKVNSDGTIGTWSCQGPSSSACGGVTPVNNNILPAERSWFGLTGVTLNGYMYAIGGTNGAGSSYSTSTIYYTSAQRLQVNASLDLVGGDASSLTDGGTTGGSSGGSLTAGNTRILGTLDVQSDVNFSQNLTVGGDLNVSGGIYTANGKVYSAVADSGSAVAFAFNTQVSYATSGGILLSVQNNGSQRFAIDYAGHIITGGAGAPTWTQANGSGGDGLLGTGGSCSVSAGNDTSGTVTLVSGSSGFTNGTLCHITFNKSYASTPRVVISPANKDSAGLDPYGGAISSSAFDIGAAGTITASKTYTINYFVTQ